MKKNSNCLLEEIEVYSYPPIDSKMYVIKKEDQLLVIDPNISESFIENYKEQQIKAVTILLTHEHFDHISGVNWFKENYNCTVYASLACAKNLECSKRNLSKHFNSLMTLAYNVSSEQLYPPYECSADVTFEESFEAELLGMHIKFFEAHGHSEGSICMILDDQYLFSGDSLIKDRKVITKLPGGSKRSYEQVTLPLLKALPRDLVVLPGHGEIGLLKEFFEEI